MNWGTREARIQGKDMEAFRCLVRVLLFQKIPRGAFLSAVIGHDRVVLVAGRHSL